MLPPTEDAFKQHVMRALFQAMIWLQTHVAKPGVKDPVGHGWARGGYGALEHNLYEKQCAPLKVRVITHPYCNGKDCNVSGKCPCLLVALPCMSHAPAAAQTAQTAPQPSTVNLMMKSVTTRTKPGNSHVPNKDNYNECYNDCSRRTHHRYDVVLPNRRRCFYKGNLLRNIINKQIIDNMTK